LVYLVYWVEIYFDTIIPTIMKTRAFTFIFVLLFVSLQGQINSISAKVSIGVSNEVFSTSNMVNNFEVDAGKYLPSYCLGLVFSRKLNNFLDLSLEPGIIRKGHKTEVPSQLSQIVSAKFNQFHLELPVLVKFYLHEKIYFDLGYAISYLANVSISLSEGTFIFDDNDYYSSQVEHSLIAGGGYWITKRINIGLRYGRGLSNINEIPFIDIFGFNTGEVLSRNQYFHLNCTYKLNKIVQDDTD